MVEKYLSHQYIIFNFKKNTEFDSIINIGGISNCTYKKIQFFILQI